METASFTIKDWFTLLVPIICNGVLIALFTKTLERKISKLSKLDENDAIVIASFVKTVDETQKALNQLKLHFSNENVNSNAQVLLNEYAACIQSLYNASIDYLFLNRYTSTILHLEKHSHMLVDFAKAVASGKEENNRRKYQRLLKNIDKDIKRLYRVKRL